MAFHVPVLSAYSSGDGVEVCVAVLTKGYYCIVRGGVAIAGMVYRPRRIDADPDRQPYLLRRASVPLLCPDIMLQYAHESQTAVLEVPVNSTPSVLGVVWSTPKARSRIRIYECRHPDRRASSPIFRFSLHCISAAGTCKGTCFCCPGQRNPEGVLLILSTRPITILGKPSLTDIDQRHYASSQRKKRTKDVCRHDSKRPMTMCSAA